MADLNDKFKTDKPLYDYSIEFDISYLPEELKLLINELEQLDKEGDWFHYDIKFDQLEIIAKSYLFYHRISESDYSKILRKYGWLSD